MIIREENSKIVYRHDPPAGRSLGPNLAPYEGLSVDEFAFDIANPALDGLRLGGAEPGNDAEDVDRYRGAPLMPVFVESAPFAKYPEGPFVVSVGLAGRLTRPLMAVAIARGVGSGDFFFGVISPRIGSFESTGDPMDDLPPFPFIDSEDSVSPSPSAFSRIADGFGDS